MVYKRFLCLFSVFCVAFLFACGSADTLSGSGGASGAFSESAPSSSFCESLAESSYEESMCEPSEEISEESFEESSTEVSMPEKTAESILNSMTLKEKVYQLFIVAPEQFQNSSNVTKSDEATRLAIENQPVGGIIYFSKNIVSPDQCIKMISGVQSYSKIPLFISVDEEGGRVARIGNNPLMGTTKFPSMSSIKTPSEAYNVGFTIGNDIKRLGFNLDFAPIADIFSNPFNTVIGDRAFGSNANETAILVENAVKGFNDSNVLCTLKHFPGHGNTSTDSHYGYAETLKTLEELADFEFLPFEAGVGAGADFVMLGHISAPNITGNSLPATLSKEIVSVLRRQIGFEGIIITDSMSMQAITNSYTSAQSAVMAVQAGVDMILIPQNLAEAVNGIIGAVNDGTITEERINQSVLKIIQIKLEKGIIE